MEFNNHSSNESTPSGDDTAIEIPLFVTYLNMAIIPVVLITVVTPAVMVIRVICNNKELHIKYYFFVANLLATTILNITVESILQYLIMILYLDDLHKDSNGSSIKWFVFPLHLILQLVTILLLSTLAIERVVVIASPYRHRRIMTKKTVAGIIATAWGLSAVITVGITLLVPCEVIWPLGIIQFQKIVISSFVGTRLISAAFIIVANIYLFWQVTKSNRKAEENQRLGNEEEAKRFTRLVQLFRMQSKATKTLLALGGIDVLASVFIPIMYVVISVSADEVTSLYLQQFLMYPIESSILLSHSLTYGMYMKKIRSRLPRFNICPRLWPCCRRSTVIRY